MAPNGNVYIVTKWAKLNAFDRNGRALWSHQLVHGAEPHYRVQPVVGPGERIYLATDDGVIHCMTAEGKEAWRTSVDGPMPEPTEGIRPVSALVTDGESLVVAFAADKTLYAFATSTGAVVWRRRIAIETARGHIDPVLVGNKVVLGTISPAVMHVLDVRNGRELWKLTLDPAWGKPSWLIPSNDTLFAGLYAYPTTGDPVPSVLALSLSDGGVKWRTTLKGGLLDAVATSPTGDLLAIHTAASSDGETRLIRYNDSTKEGVVAPLPGGGKYTFLGGLASVAADGLVYAMLVDLDAELTAPSTTEFAALRFSDGRRVHKLSTPLALNFSGAPAVLNDGTVIVSWSLRTKPAFRAPQEHFLFSIAGPSKGLAGGGWPRTGLRDNAGTGALPFGR